MIDISNKLHALVDEFVSNLSSECDSLANNISSQAQKYVSMDTKAEAAKTPRLSNRTTTEVLNGLIRPSSDRAISHHHTEGKPHMDHDTANVQEGKTRTRDRGRFVRNAGEKKPRTPILKENGNQNDVTSAEFDSDNTWSKDGSDHGRGTSGLNTKGKSMHTIEILSSDQSSDEGIRTTHKQSKKPMVRQSRPKITNPSSRGRSTEEDFRSPPRSPESSHILNYSYEKDTHSLGGRSPAIETIFPKLRWPANDDDTSQEGGKGKALETNTVHGSNDSRKRTDRKKGDEKGNEGDQSNEEDSEGPEHGGESEGEEMPVLPKVPVKRKLMSEPRSAERSSQRGKTKSGNVQTKKPRTPVIDASVITQLEFGKRPQNCVSIASLSLCGLLMCGFEICNAN